LNFIGSLLISGIYRPYGTLTLGLPIILPIFSPAGTFPSDYLRKQIHIGRKQITGQNKVP